MQKQLQTLQVISNSNLILNREYVTSLKNKTVMFHSRQLSQQKSTDNPIILKKDSIPLISELTQQSTEKNLTKSLLMNSNDISLTNLYSSQTNSFSAKTFTPISKYKEGNMPFFRPKNILSTKEIKQKTSFQLSQKSKSVIYPRQSQRRQSTITNKNDGSFTPMSYETPKWENIQKEFSNPQENLLVIKQNLNTVKKSNFKLQKDYESMRDQIMLSLKLMEEESRNNGKQPWELRKTMDIMEKLVCMLSEASMNELKLSIAISESKEKTDEIVQLKKQVEQLHIQLSHLQSENRNIFSIKEQTEKELQLKQRDLYQIEKNRKVDKRKIEQLEKRLELLLETNFVEYANDKEERTSNVTISMSNQKTSQNFTSTSSSLGKQSLNQQPNQNPQSLAKLRQMLSELVKDNEQLKKDSLNLEIEILHNKDNEQKLNQKISSLNQKVESMRKKLSEKEIEDIQQEEQQLFTSKQKPQLLTSINLLKRLIIPEEVDFRINSMKLEYSQILVINRLGRGGGEEREGKEENEYGDIRKNQFY